MKLPPLVLGNLTAKVPIIQGGMGVGISRSSLASAVAREGGVGMLSGVQIGFSEPDFEENCKEANIRALRREIKKAKENSLGGIIGLNLMVAMNNYDDMVKAAMDEGIDIIVSGAGLPTSLPGLVKGTKTMAAPIVSSAKAAALMCKVWDRKFQYIPDLIVVEGPEAGGHLGFSIDKLQEGNKPPLKGIVTEVIAAIKPYEKKYNKKIPVAAGGGVFTGQDIAELLNIGASAAQMATRFVATEECDADIRYKQAYVNCSKEDIQLVISPVGMPGRAIHNEFINKMESRESIVTKCYDCLKTCDPKNTPYCISRALIEAVNGNLDKALIFTGSNAYRIKGITTVKKLMGELVQEAEEAYKPV